jgi:thiamine-phosphate pyrophosphorylase
MAERCLLYYITDRAAFSGDESSRTKRLLEKIFDASRAGVDYIQLREKDLPTRDLESLAREAVRAIREAGKRSTALLINSRTDVALATGADGVHLRADDISPQDVKAIWQKGARNRHSPLAPLIGVSCHSPEEVQQAGKAGATFAVFAPVFEKKDAPDSPAKGLSQLEEATKSNIPVLALGGVTLANAQSCLEAGAAGIAGIRLFQENDIRRVAHELRNLQR